MNLLYIFWRGYLIVLLTAMNVGQISGSHYLGAFLTAFGISWVWWHNAHTAAHNGSPWAGYLYGLGAASGTLTGMGIVHWLYQ